MDDELLGLARERIGDEFELTSQQSARLRGTTAAELRADAKAMRAELGLEPFDDDEPKPERDQQGRFTSGGGSSINKLIRQATGRTS